MPDQLVDPSFIVGTDNEGDPIGSVAVLNVGLGDAKLTFDNDDPGEVLRVGQMVKDMIRRGYMLMVEREDGKYERAQDFDPETAEYIIAGYDPIEEDDGEGQEKPQGKAKTSRKKASKKRGKTKRVPAKGTRAVAASKTAGG